MEKNLFLTSKKRPDKAVTEFTKAVYEGSTVLGLVLQVELTVVSSLKLSGKSTLYNNIEE